MVHAVQRGLLPIEESEKPMKAECKHCQTSFAECKCAYCPVCKLCTDCGLCACNFSIVFVCSLDNGSPAGLAIETRESVRLLIPGSEFVSRFDFPLGLAGGQDTLAACFEYPDFNQMEVNATNY